MNKHLSTQRGTNAPNRDVNAANRVALALELRASRMTYEAIARQCGYSTASSCRKAVLRELDRCVVKQVEILRNEELDSLDRLERECWQRFQDDDYAKSKMFAVDRILAIKERRAKMLGLDVARDTAIAANQVIVRELPANYLSLNEAKSE